MAKFNWETGENRTIDAVLHELEDRLVIQQHAVVNRENGNVLAVLDTKEEAEAEKKIFRERHHVVIIALFGVEGYE